MDVRGDHKEGWVLKNWCFWTVLLEKTLENLLDCKEIKPVHPKGNQSWIFIERSDAEAEAPIIWPPDAKNWLLGKDHEAGKDWRQEEKRTTEDEMVGWHHRLDGHEFEQALEVGDGQGSLGYCSPWGHKESDTTKQLNWASWKAHYNSGPHFSRLSRKQCQDHSTLQSLSSTVNNSQYLLDLSPNLWLADVISGAAHLRSNR